MKKLKQLIEDWIYFGKAPVKGITPYQLDVLIDVYNGLVSSGKAEFIQGDVYRVLEKCKIKVREHGIGWVAYK